MASWLIKTDPETYSFDDLLRERKTRWDGIRNHQAKLYLAQMKRGDACFFYHSGAEPAVVGTAKIVKAAYADPTAGDAPWVAVDIQAGKRLPRPVPLAEIKGHRALSKMVLVRQGRLSVSPVSDAERDTLLELASRTV